MQTAVINEGIRLMFGTTTRLPRVSPTEPLIYKNWIIPAGVSNAPPHCLPQLPHPLSLANPDTDPTSTIDACERIHLLRQHGQCHLPQSGIIRSRPLDPSCSRRSEARSISRLLLQGQ